MIIREWENNLVVTDNILTNLPISQLSSIPMDVNGLLPTDRILISKLCDLSNMTDTGYMSYSASLAAVSSFAYRALDIEAITSNMSQISTNLDGLLGFRDMLQNMTRRQSADVSVYNEAGEFDPFVISSIYAISGILLDELSGYRFSYAVDNIFKWKTFNDLTVQNLAVANINGVPYKHLNYAIPENTYQGMAKAANTYYFTYSD